MLPFSQTRFLQNCPPTLAPDTSVEFAVQIMNQENIGYVLVLEQNQLLGIFTQGDLVKAIASGVNLRVATLSDVMTHDVISIKESELGDISSTVNLLKQHQISYLPVLDEQGQLLGAIALAYLQVALFEEIDRHEQLVPTQPDCQTQLDAIISSMRTIISKIRLPSSEEFFYEYISPNCLNILGYSPDEFLADPSLWNTRLLPEDQDAILHHIEDAITTQEIVTIEYPFTHKDGSVCWICDTFSSDWDETTQSWLVMSVKTDITQRKQTEEALRTSEERLQLALETSGDGVWDWNIPSGYLYLSPRWCKMLGYSVEELANDVSTWEQLLHPEDRFWVMDILQSHLIDSSIPYTFEYRMQTKSGGWKWIANYGKVVSRDKNGQPLRMAGIHRDVSDRKRAEQALQEREAFLRAIGDNIPNSYLYQIVRETDGSDRFYYISAGVEAANGFHPTEVLADFSLLYNNLLPEDRLYISHKQEESARNMSVFDVEVREYTPTREIRWIRLCSTPRRLDDGRICWDGIRLDITEQKLTEERLRKSTDLLTEAQRVAQIGNWEFDLATQKITWTEELFHILDKDPALLEPTYDENLQIYQPQDAQRLHKAVEQAITTGESYKLTLKRNPRPDGSIRYIEGTGHADFNADGQITRLYGTAQDITERFLAEQSLQNKEQFLSSIYNGVEQCIFVVDVLDDGEFRFVDVNPAYARLTGIRATDIQGKTLEDLLRPELASSVRQHYQACIAARETITYEECLPILRQDTWWITSLTPLFDENSRIYRIVGSGTNISDRKRLELALQASESRLNNILTTANASIVSFRVFANYEWEYEYQSIGSEALFGFTPAEIVSDNQLWMSQVFAEDREQVLYPLFEKIFAERTSTIEYRFHHKDGSLRWISATYSSHRDEAADCWIVTGVSVDISDRKRLELALQASEKRLQNILSTASASIFSFRISANQEWEYEYQSAASEIIFGYSPAEILADKKLWISRVLPEDREQVMYARFQRSIAEGSNSIEYRFRHKDGSVRWISTTYSSVRQEETNTWVVIGVSIDVSSLKLAEEAMRQSETLFRTLSDSAPVGIFRSDTLGTNIYTNPRFQSICGLSLEDSFGDRWLQYIHPEDLAVFWPQWQDLATVTLEFCTEVRYIRTDSTLRFLRITIVPILSSPHEIIGYVGTIEDITESRAIEKMKNEFVSIVSHELRTPLASIRGALGLLSSGVLQTQPETSQQMLDIAYSDTERLVRLVNDILDLEHLESNKFSLVKQRCDAAILIRQSVEALQPLATANNVALEMSLTSIKISVDPDRIMQTLLNLIGNAIKFSPANSTVTLSVEDLSDRILFKVQDQGRGIPNDMLETIFGRFQQVDASDSRQKGGTGLGLAICRGIVQQHGGTIWAESVLGEGSIFYFTIPKPEI
ncbi:PAS domain-containing protein [Tolypothrix sp. PCC 7910]|uniref:PAS domain-containing protein n=1 Tax=Tolypothrix sp. PCC 7910 TaxID=2099387 RepID=UPI00142783A0|nr:PAS domain-containing protein [Tolypothrix sp. PCC 7910]QIR37381.1 PAS domain-containing protein [Tolypothrix sp. PCC 7910]